MKCRMQGLVPSVLAAVPVICLLVGCSASGGPETPLEKKRKAESNASRKYDISAFPGGLDEFEVHLRVLTCGEGANQSVKAGPGDTVTVSASAQVHRLIREYLDFISGAEKRMRDAEWEACVGDLLRSHRVSFDFNGVKLCDAVARLTAETRRILCPPKKEGDGFELPEAGYEEDAELAAATSFVTRLQYGEDKIERLCLNDISLYNAWKWLAEGSGRHWALQDRAVYFGPASKERPVMRTYAMYDLFRRPPWLPEDRDWDRSGVEPSIQIIQNMHADSWVDPHKIEYHRGMLLVVNTPHVHRSLRRLFADLRKHLGRRGVPEFQYPRAAEGPETGSRGWSSPSWDRRLGKVLAGYRVNGRFRSLDGFCRRMTAATGITFLAQNLKRAEGKEAVTVPICINASLPHVMDRLAASAQATWEIRNEALFLWDRSRSDREVRGHLLDGLRERVPRPGPQAEEPGAEPLDEDFDFIPRWDWVGFKPEVVKRFAKALVGEDGYDGGILGYWLGHLFLNGTPETHERMAAFLDILREARSLPEGRLCTRGVPFGGQVPGLSRELLRMREDVPAKGLEARRVSLECRKMPLAGVLEELSKKGGIGLVLSLPDDDVRPITVDLTAVTVKQAIDKVSETAGLDWTIRFGGVSLAPAVPPEPVLRLYPLERYVDAKDPNRHIIKEIGDLAPESWVKPNRVEYDNGILFILNTEGVHRKIQKHLGSGRK